MYAQFCTLAVFYYFDCIIIQPSKKQPIEEVRLRLKSIRIKTEVYQKKMKLRQFDEANITYMDERASLERKPVFL